MSNLYLLNTKNKHSAYLVFQKKKIECFVGEKSVGNKKREGDRVTPRGTFKLLNVHYRYDKVGNIKTTLPKIQIKKNSLWCVDPSSPFYNCYIERFTKFKCEKLFRKDSLYDIFITLDYNIRPTKKFKGSAIFIHCCDRETRFTEGCLAFEKKYIFELLKFIKPTTKIIIF